MPSKKHKHHRKHKGHLDKEDAPFACNRYSWRIAHWIIECRRKRWYPNRQTALAACRQVYEATGDAMLQPYKCRIKNHWHIGHWQPRQFILRVVPEELD